MKFLGKMTIFGALVLLGATTALAREPVRIDAASEQAADASYKQMVGTLSQRQQIELAVAVIQLNMAGKTSAYDVVSDKSLQSPTAGRIKDRIAGMSADEIIALSHTAADVTTTVEIEAVPAPRRPLERG
jgi:hypothetical protein